jgi:hypothetical protein
METYTPEMENYTIEMENYQIQMKRSNIATFDMSYTNTPSFSMIAK